MHLPLTRPGVLVAAAIAAGVAAVYALPPPWLAPLSTAAAIGCAIFALMVRLTAKTERPTHAAVGILLLLVNLPEQPLATVKDGWVLSAFLTSAAFLVSLAVSVLVRAGV